MAHDNWYRTRPRLGELFRKDPQVSDARRHTSYETVRHIDARIDRFRQEPPEVQRTVLLLLRRDVITHEPGNRGVSASALVAGVASAATAVTAVVAAILAGYLGFAGASTPTDPKSSETLLSSLFTWVMWGIAVLLFVVAWVWISGGRRDRRRAMATVWHHIFTHAQNQTPLDQELIEESGIRAWLRSPPTTELS